METIFKGINFGDIIAKADSLTEAFQELERQSKKAISDELIEKLGKFGDKGKVVGEDIERFIKKFDVSKGLTSFLDMFDIKIPKSLLTSKPSLEDITEGISKLGASFEPYIPGITGFINNGLAKIIPVISTIFTVLGPFKSLLPSIIGHFGSWSTVLKAVGASTLTAIGPIIGIAAAVVGGIAIFVALIQSWKDVWNACQVVWKAIHDVIGSYVDNFMKMFGALGKIVWGALTFNKDMMQAGFDDAKSAVTGFAGDVGKAAQKSVDALGKAGSSMWDNIKKDATKGTEFISGLMGNTKKIEDQVAQDHANRAAQYEKDNLAKEQSEKALTATTNAEAGNRDKTEKAAAAIENGYRNDYINNNQSRINSAKGLTKAQLDELKAQALAEQAANQTSVQTVQDAEKKKQGFLAETFDAISTGLKNSAQNVTNWGNTTGATIQNWAKQASEAVNKWGSTFKDITGKLSELSSQYYSNKNAELDNYYKAEKDRINNSTMSEEEKKKALDNLDADTDKKRRKLAREQAQTNKDISIFNAIINTAQAVVTALATPPFWVGLALAVTAGVMGAAQIALIRQQPLPALAAGGFITSPGLTLVGEQGPEILNLPSMASVIPLNRPEFSFAGLGGYGTANIVLEIDGRTLVKQLGEPLRDMLRIKTGMR